MFDLPPEPCSASGRNAVRLQTGIVFGLERNPHECIRPGVPLSLADAKRLVE